MANREWYSEDRKGINAAFAPGKIENLGYLYILELDSGVIKVGKATTPHVRLRNHISNAAAMGRVVVRGWVSTPHKNFSENEQELIRACAAKASRVIRREYFEGIGIAAARDLVRAMEFLPWTSQDEQAAQERVDRIARVWRSVGSGSKIAVTQSYIDAAERWLRFDRSAPMPDGTSRAVTDPSDVDTPPFVSRDSEVYQLLERIANAKGVDIEEVADWSYIDVIGDLLTTQALTTKQEWIIFAYESGRDDLLSRPWVELDPSEAS